MIAVVNKLLRQLGFLDVDDAPRRRNRAQQDARQAFRLGDFRLEYGIDDGLRFFREVRNPGLKRTPVIAVSGDSKERERGHSKKAGMEAYLVEPFEAETLKAKIETALAARTAAY
jgi:two-component system, chemotaxis family, chemotaxis protein CheY